VRQIVPQCFPAILVPVRRISSRQNELVARFRAAARREDPGEILLDGPHLVADALSAGLDLREIAVSAAAVELAEIAPLLRQLADAGLDPVVATAPVMDAISPVRSSSPIVALAGRPDAAAARTPSPRGPTLLLVAIDVQDPGNLGAIVRVAEAAGATGLVTAGTSADPFGWKALRGSMGSALRFPIDTAPTPMAGLDHARRLGCRVVATTPHGGRSLFDADFTGPTAIVVGGEGRGLAPAVLESADERVIVPMEAPVESLNAAVTAALLLYESRRQRRH